MRERGSIAKWVFSILGILAVVSLALEFGFGFGDRMRHVLAVLDIAIAVVFGGELLVALAIGRLRALRERWYEYLLLVLFLAAAGFLQGLAPHDAFAEKLARWQVTSVTKLYLVLVQIFLVFDALVRFLRGHAELLDRTVHPERIFAGGFALLILAGAGLLLLPRSSASQEDPIGILDAFFTSTSAVCVTGLVVRDTAADFTTFGQVAIGLLFQVGGLGIITFVAFLSLASGRTFSVPQMVALRKLTNAESLSDVRKQVLAIVATALTIELLGTLVLLGSGAAPAGTLAMRLHWSAFHAVSAFCNAGFALAADSFSAWSGNAVVNLCLMALIVLGGLGAPVIRDVWRTGLVRLRRARGSREAQRRLSAQTRISLLVTGILIVAGFVGFIACELRGVLAGRGPGETILASLFLSITARTAGFNTVPTEGLGDAAMVLLVVLMVIGASPVSTGGGIKTTAAGVLFLTLRSMVTGREVEAYGRTVPQGIVRASTSVFVLYTFAAVLATLALSLTDPAVAFGDRIFEVISALSTVGLSRGITADLSDAGKVVLCLSMFAGRVGPLTMVMTVLRSASSANYRLPEEPMVLS